jgi:hypothetical protein
MRWMLTAAVLALSLVTPVIAEDAIAPAEKTPLFNGQDLSGWVRFAPGGNVDEMWSVKDGVIHCTGQPNGYIRTEKAYRDYRLRVEWRWADKPTNSGVLLHMDGQDRVWPKCIEAQLMHEKAGDFWIIMGSSLKVGDKVQGPGEYINVPKREASSEKPVGEWNQYEITCRGGLVRLVINGVLQNEGTESNPASGHICLQSEGSPIEFRNVEIEPLTGES